FVEAGLKRLQLSRQAAAQLTRFNMPSTPTPELLRTRIALIGPRQLARVSAQYDSTSPVTPQTVTAIIPAISFIPASPMAILLLHHRHLRILQLERSRWWTGAAFPSSPMVVAAKPWDMRAFSQRAATPRLPVLPFLVFGKAESSLAKPAFPHHRD